MTPRDAFTEFDLDAGPVGPARGPDGKWDEMVPKSRLDEALAQNTELKRGREDIIQSMLNGSLVRADVGAPAEENPLSNGFEPVFPEGTDDDVKELLTPILKQNIELAVNGVKGTLDSRLAPVENQMDYARAIENVRGRVEGFDTVKDDIVRIFQNLTPEDQAEYNSELGIEALAQRALRERQEARRNRPSMAHSGPVHNSGLGPTGTPQESPEGVWGMNEAEFENYLARKGSQA